MPVPPLYRDNGWLVSSSTTMVEEAPHVLGGLKMVQPIPTVARPLDGSPSQIAHMAQETPTRFFLGIRKAYAQLGGERDASIYCARGS